MRKWPVALFLSAPVFLGAVQLLRWTEEQHATKEAWAYPGLFEAIFYMQVAAIVVLVGYFSFVALTIPRKAKTRIAPIYSGICAAVALFLIISSRSASNFLFWELFMPTTLVLPKSPDLWLAGAIGYYSALTIYLLCGGKKARKEATAEPHLL